MERIARGKMEWKRFQRMFEGFYGGEMKYEEGRKAVESEHFDEFFGGRL